MTTPKLYADREATMTDEEIAALRAVAACMPPRQTEVWARDMLRLCDALTEARRERDDLTRKLEEACAAEQRAAIRAGEWMRRVEEARRERDEARDMLGRIISLRHVDFAAGETTDVPEDAAVHAMMTTIGERDEARRQVATAREAERRDVLAMFEQTRIDACARYEQREHELSDESKARVSMALHGGLVLLAELKAEVEAGRHVAAPRPAYDPGGPPLWRCSNCGCPEDDHAIGQPRSKCNGCECTEYERCAWASTAEENAAAVAASRGGEEG